MRALRRLMLGLVLLIGVAGGLWLWWPSTPDSDAPQRAEGPQSAYIPSIDPPAGSAISTGGPQACDQGSAPAGAAAANALSLSTLAWSPFGKPEQGWEIYAPRIAAEIGATCGPQTQAFAAALARWQGARGLRPSGVLDPETFAAMAPGWHLARPFVRVNRQGLCPGAPPEASLVEAAPAETYGGKAVRLRPAALAAYRRMVEAARADGVSTRAGQLAIFSGFRAPDADAARCARERNCQGLVRTICSAHRTGLAVDLVLEGAPGFGPASTDDVNRLAMARSPAYRWMVANAGRFGFVNYVYEPWHWEWTGEPLLPGRPISSLPQAGSEPVIAPPPES